MGQIITYAVFAATIVAALRYPWIGVAAGYTFILMLPQEVWPWNFEGIRHFKMVAIPTMLGLLFAIASNKVDASRLKTKICLFYAIWCFFTIVSYYFGPFVGAGKDVFDPYWVLVTMLKSFLFFYIGVVCIDNDKKFRLMIYVAVAAAIVLTWWANNRYLLGEMGGAGRLRGPDGMDENGFAMFFVTTAPYLWYYGMYVKNYSLCQCSRLSMSGRVVV
jgi:hypothetical protein